MAQLHTPQPGHPGELELARQLVALEDDRLHLWFGVNYIPGVPDIDVVVWHEEAGVFCIEVKAVPIEELEWYGWNLCKIVGRNESQGPHQQAQRGVHCLRNHLGAMPGKPFITSAACWPLIGRREWNTTWDDDRVCGPYADSMIMRDDLFADPGAFRDRLEHIRLHPNMGADRQLEFIHKAPVFQEFCRALNATARPEPTPSDYERLRILEANITDRTRKETPAYGEKRIVYSGRPGTGKSFRLLKTAIFHAMEGCDVLFVCFNKVLATDIRRLLGFSERVQLSNGSIKVHDVYEILELFASCHQFELDNNYDEWAELVLDEMKRTPGVLPKYDTILVDEGQDIRQWAYEMIELHAKASATICVAAGEGQELYGEEAPWLSEFRKRSEGKRLRRVFRNPRAVFQLATLCFETELKAERIAAVYRRLEGGKSSSGQLTFERGEGDLPRLVAIDDSRLAGLNSDPASHEKAQAELMAGEYARIIQREVDELGKERRPVDLLLLVPSRNRAHYPWVIEALKRADLSYIDYTDEKQRRYVPSPGTIRLCTYHSSRGTEGDRVVVFGLEQLKAAADRAKVDAHRLGYIVLSRAVMQLVIPYRRTASSPVIEFVQKAVAHIRKCSGVSVQGSVPGRPRAGVGGAY